MYTKLTAFILTLLLLCTAIYAQNFSEATFINQQQLEGELRTAATQRERVYAYIRLYLHHRSHSEPFNKTAAAAAEKSMEIEAERSGDPHLVAMVMANKMIYASGAPHNDELRPLLNRLLHYSKVHHLADFEAIAKMREAIYYGRWKSDLAKATECVTQSLAFLPQLEDTLQIDLVGVNADTYNNTRKYVEALKLGFLSLEKAITIKDIGRMARSHIRISDTYRYLQDYEKAIRHMSQALQIVEKNDLIAMKPRIYSSLARLYIFSDQQNLAEHYVNEAFRWAGINKGSKRLFNQITGELIVAICEKKNQPLLRHFMTHYRHHFFISPNLEFTDHFTLAHAFGILGRQDSARYFLAKAATLTHKTPGAADYRRYLEAAGMIALKENGVAEASAYYREGLEKGLRTKNPESLLSFSDSLKTIALKMRDYKAALEYDRLNDSLKAEEALRNSEDEIMRQEVAGLEAQKALEVKAAEDRKNQRNNLQYLGITAAIVGLFIMLLLMGLFQVSARTVRILSFFSFLLFFEFIFLIFKKKIAVYTGGEPLKDLAFMVALAALMVPLHHWAEHKAIHYLTHRTIGWGRKKPVAPAVSLTEPVKELHQ